MNPGLRRDYNIYLETLYVKGVSDMLNEGKIGKSWKSIYWNV